MNRTILFLVLSLAACDAKPGVVFELSPLTVDFGLALVSQCSSELRQNEDVLDGTCKVISAGSERAFFASNLTEDVEPMTCHFELTGTTDCSGEKHTLFVARFDSPAFDEGGTMAQVAAAGIDTQFDDDHDGFSNYREYLAGSSPTDPHSMPPVTGMTADAGVGDAR